MLSSETRFYGHIFLKAALKAFRLRPGFSWVNYLKHVVEGLMYTHKKAGRERKEGLAQWRNRKLHCQQQWHKISGPSLPENQLFREWFSANLVDGWHWVLRLDWCSEHSARGENGPGFRKLSHLVVIFFKLNKKYFFQFCFYWARHTWMSLLCCLSWFDVCWCGT